MTALVRSALLVAVNMAFKHSLMRVLVTVASAFDNLTPSIHFRCLLYSGFTLKICFVFSLVLGEFRICHLIGTSQ